MVRQEPGEPFFRVEPEEARRMLQDNQVVLVDVRGAEDYRKAHIPGARLIELEQVYTRIGELAGAPGLLFVCYRGVTSALACEVAAAAGHTRVFNLEGGMEAWEASGYPVEPGPPR